MNNAGIALRQMRELHHEMVSLDSSNNSILKVSRTIELFMQKAARDTNGYRKRLNEAFDILSARNLDPVIMQGLDGAGMDKNMIEDLTLAKNKPIDKAFESLRDLQQVIVDIKVAKRDLVNETRQLERHLKNSSDKIKLYEETLSGMMTFLGQKGMLDPELIQAFNGSKTSKETTDAILKLQSRV